MKKKLIIVGAGSFAREVINWAYDALVIDGLTGFQAYLGQPDAFADYSYDLSYLGPIEEYMPVKGDLFVIAVGDPFLKKVLVTKLKERGAEFISLIHPSSVIARTANLGEGVVVCPNAVVTADSRIGDFVTINVLSSVGHDAIVGDFSTLSAHVDLTGFVNVGDMVFFGTGAKVLPKIKIGRQSKIGAGAIIMRNVADGATMYTLPAKKL